MLVRASAPAVPLAVAGPFRMFDGRGAEIRHDNSKLGRLAVTFKDGCLSLGAFALIINGQEIPRLRLAPQRLGSLEVDGKVYPGDVELIGVRGTATLHAVVHMEIEEYVAGVLAGEVPVENWHDEALKAQAVTSRTYALYYSLKNARESWDFGTSGRDAQEYRAGIVRNARINRAVNLTAGEVLACGNQVFPAYFHSSCGGHTVDAAEVFTRQSIPALAGAECKWCTRQPENKYAAWKKEFSIGTLAYRLRRAADANPNLKPVAKLGDIRAVEVAATSPDGRITRFLVRGPFAPGSLEMAANDFRGALGWSELPSTKCQMTAAGSRYCFAGSGWGHGVGLCQWGSQGMALAGAGYQEVLANYFPLSRLVKMSYARSTDAAGG
jgi:stage II sporulation protein D